MRVTIRSIAEKAQVSRGTVDKVLNDRVGVSPEVRDHVKKIAEEFGYKPNLAGKALAFQKAPLKIGVIILNINDYVFKEIEQGVKAAYQELKDFGISVETCIMESQDAEEQLRCIRVLRKKNVSAIALSPLDEQVIKDELEKLAKEKIKVVMFNTYLDDVEKLCFIGQDTKKSGRAAAHLMKKMLPHGGNVLIISGVEKLKAVNDRVLGFEEVIESEFPKLKVIEVVKNVIDDVYSFEKTKEILSKANSAINAIYITAGGIGGVGKAILELDRHDIKLVCFDEVPETIELIKKNVIDFTITQDPFMQGYLPIKVIFEYYFQKKVPANENIYTDIEIRITENIK